MVTYGSLHVNSLVHLRGAGITGGGAGIAHHHGKIAFLVALLANLQVPPGMQRLSVIVNAVQGKIGLVLRPFPVVFVSAEGRHRHRRSSHQTDVRVFVVKAHIVPGAVPHAGEAGFQAVFFRILFLHHGGQAAHAEGLSLYLQGIAQGLHLFGDVQHLPQEEEFFSREGNLLGAVLGPEALFQVVMFRCGELDHVLISAVMVGDEEAVLGNHAAAAVEAQRHHGIGQAARLFVIDFPGAQLEAARFHIFLQRPVQALDEPHSFIGPGRKGRQAKEQRYDNLFHYSSV